MARSRFFPRERLVREHLARGTRQAQTMVNAALVAVLVHVGKDVESFPHGSESRACTGRLQDG
jgi:hypothetical protein